MFHVKHGACTLASYIGYEDHSNLLIFQVTKNSVSSTVVTLLLFQRYSKWRVCESRGGTLLTYPEVFPLSAWTKDF